MTDTTNITIDPDLGSEFVDPEVLGALAWVMQARRNAIAKFGPLTYVRENVERQALILCEEAGEVAAEALKMGKPGSPGSHRGAIGTVGAMRYELAQVAQHAIAMIINLNIEETEANK